MIAAGTEPAVAVDLALAELNASDLLARSLAGLAQAHWTDPTPAGARAFSWATFASEIRQSIRRLARQPAYLVIAVVTLSCGIGANAATFAAADWLLFRPLPGVRDESTLVTIRLANGDEGLRSPLSSDDVRALQASMPALTGLAGYVDLGGFLAVTAGLPGDLQQRVQADTVTASYFPVLGTPLMLGRSFTEVEGSDAAAQPAAIVSERFFRAALHGDPRRVGQPFVVNGHEVTLAGVAGPGFAGTRRTERIDLWLPAAQRAIATPARGDQMFFALAARRKADASLGVVRDQLRAAEAAIVQANPGTKRFTTRHLVATSGLEPADFELQAMRGTFVMLLGFAGLLFLLACANVANANLARTAARRSDIATRLALGASRAAIARTLFVDSLIPAVIAGVVAVAVAHVALVALEGTTILIGKATLDGIHLDWRVLLVGIALAAVSAGATGMWPMLVGARVGVASVIRERDRSQSGRQRLARTLMAIQVTLSFVLLVGAVLFARSMSARLAVSPGFDDDRVLTFAVYPLGL